MSVKGQEVMEIINSPMKFRVLWDVEPCSNVQVDRRFRGAYCLHQALQLLNCTCGKLLQLRVGLAVLQRCGHKRSASLSYLVGL
jgi:hypothetical protein